MSETVTPAQWWEARYAESGQIWSGRVNRVLADIVIDLDPGTALDLGCGEAGDAVWLARHGWTVTGVDLSPTAIERGRAAGRAAGVRPGALHLVAADLATWTGPECYALVTASFLHSWPVPIPRELILRRATGFVAPGGHLMIVSHVEAPSWADPDLVHAHQFPTPDGDLRALELEPDRWEVLLCETRQRDITAPDGSPATLRDGVVLVRRLSTTARSGGPERRVG